MINASMILVGAETESCTVRHLSAEMTQADDNLGPWDMTTTIHTA